MNGRRGSLRVVLGDQLTASLSALRDLGPHDVVLMAEVMTECTYVPHHQKKLVLVLSAMRHFAALLRGLGVAVDYISLEDPANTQSLAGEVRRAIARHRPTDIIATEPGEWRVQQDMLTWAAEDGPALDIRDDDRFLCSIRAFRSWGAGRKELRMEYFYREMRRRHDLLMDGAKPEGGNWNYDVENRKRLPRDISVPVGPRYDPDATTQEVMAIVARRFAEHFGSVVDFDLPVTETDAAHALSAFLDQRLADFGVWQDAMRTGEALLFHAGLASALNLGLLDPLGMCRAVEAAYRAGHVALNSAEGFIRQIAGWREFMRGVYWTRMPEYRELNALGAARALPWFYWSGETAMNCVHQAVADTERRAYAHHIQRLMITGNFALLAGLDPDEVDRWYMVVYADAYEWVEMPNTRGMALYADGGVVGSKPYAASGAYINRMSNYCADCRYDVHDAVGEQACPFNALYWDFIARHEQRFAANPRMAMPRRSWARMDPTRQAQIRTRAAALFSMMDKGQMI